MRKNSFIFILLLSLFLPFIASANQKLFNDDNVSYLQAANYLAGKDIIVDHSDDESKYNLSTPILRQEMAGIVAKIAKVQEKTFVKINLLM